jgi:hypothetical protein
MMAVTTWVMFSCRNKRCLLGVTAGSQTAHKTNSNRLASHHLNKQQTHPTRIAIEPFTLLQAAGMPPRYTAQTTLSAQKTQQRIQGQ